MRDDRQRLREVGVGRGTHEQPVSLRRLVLRFAASLTRVVAQPRPRPVAEPQRHIVHLRRRRQRLRLAALAADDRRRSGRRSSLSRRARGTGCMDRPCRARTRASRCRSRGRACTPARTGRARPCTGLSRALAPVAAALAPRSSRWTSGRDRTPVSGFRSSSCATNHSGKQPRGDAGDRRRRVVVVRGRRVESDRIQPEQRLHLRRQAFLDDGMVLGSRSSRRARRRSRRGPADRPSRPARRS